MSRKLRAPVVISSLRSDSRRQHLRLVTIFLLVAALCSYLDFFAPTGFNYFERYAQSLRLGLNSAVHSDRVETAKKQVALLIISDETFLALNLPGPPVPRSYHAKVLRELQRAGAKVVAFDLVFDLGSPHDREFARAVREVEAKGMKVMWACVFNNENSAQQQIIWPNAELMSASRFAGHINMPQTTEYPVIEKLQPVVPQRGGQAVPSFSLQAARLALGLEQQPLARAPGGWKLGDRFVPTDGRDHFAINFLGKPAIMPGESLGEISQTAMNEIYTPITYETVAQGALSGEFFKGNPGLIRDKIIIIGDSTKVGNDHRYTAVGEMWGPEIHAHAMTTFLHGLKTNRFLHDATRLQNFLALLLSSALVCWIAARWKLLRAALAAAALLALYFAFNVAVFAYTGLSLHLVAPSVAMLLSALLVLTARGLTEEREKNRMHGLLQRYVSPQVAAYIVAHPEKCILGGERVRATVLFSDIRGFTSLSEKLTPEEVLGRLNEYLQVMTDAVFTHEGAVDKYIGDAIMALYGAPVRHRDHARRAVATALDMQAALLKLQEVWQKQGLPIIDIGIGINTGDMVVGNMGSDQRMDFSVIGDSVNLASRVEGLNKEMGSRILITASTYAYVRDDIEVRGPLTASVKGKEETCEVYEVYGWRGGRPSGQEVT
ncbi:MAG TPA: adenylate/guanylate cyclase domain-containing protein [Abditibacteriaceae bacterium]|jgi:adenylate cyclase